MRVKVGDHTGGSEYEVRFEFEWHNPPLDGSKTHLPRIKQTTLCRINRVRDDGTLDAATFVGKRQCSIADRYNYMKGVRESLDSAITSAMGGTFATTKWEELRAQVLPKMAEERKLALQARKSSRPGVRAYRRLALQADADLEAIRLITSIGVEAFVDQKIAERKFAQDAVKL